MRTPHRLATSFERAAARTWPGDTGPVRRLLEDEREAVGMSGARPSTRPTRLPGAPTTTLPRTGARRGPVLVRLELGGRGQRTAGSRRRAPAQRNRLMAAARGSTLRRRRSWTGVPAKRGAGISWLPASERMTRPAPLEEAAISDWTRKLPALADLAVGERPGEDEPPPCEADAEVAESLREGLAHLETVFAQRAAACPGATPVARGEE